MGDVLSPAPAASPTATRFSSPWKSSATQGTFVSPSSAAQKKTVVLFDWWLIKANSAFEGKILAVSGFTTRQHATRIFCSAPIVKRHDAYTLEASDGIIVLLQGMINKARMQENVFPFEAYNHFLIGFPYNWNHYAEEYFKKGSSTATNLSSLYEASKDSTDRTGSAFPIHLHEFPMSKVLNLLSFAGDKLTPNFSHHLKLFMSASTDSVKKKSSFLPVDDDSRHDMDKNNRNISGSAVSVESHAEHSNTASCRQIECSNSDGSKGLTVSKEGTVGMLKKSSLTNMTETVMDNNSHSFVDHGENIHVQNSLKLNTDTEHLTNSMDVGRNSTFNSQLSKGSDVSHLSSILDEQNLGKKSMSYGTEEHSPIVTKNNYPSIGICTRSGRILRSPSSFCRSMRSKDKSTSLYKMKARKVSKEYETANTMMETSNEKPNNISFEEKGLASASEDHASTLNTHQDHVIVSDKCSSDSSIKLLCTEPLRCSHQISPVSSHATTEELKKQNGLSIDHVVVENNTYKSRTPKNITKFSTQSNPPAVAQSSKVKTIKSIGKNMVKKANNQDSKEPAALPEGPSKNKEVHVNGRRKLFTPTTYGHQSPLTRDKAERFSMASPESLNLRRSRSGRLIVPPLDSGRQQIVYDADGSITGITLVDMLSSLSRGGMSKPRKRRKML